MSCGVSLADGDYIWERRMVREKRKVLEEEEEEDVDETVDVWGGKKQKQSCFFHWNALFS